MARWPNAACRRYGTMPISQDVVESFIILLDQLGDDLVFFFRFGDISLQPLIIGCSRNTDLPAQPADVLALFCVALLDCFRVCGMAQPAEFHLPYPAMKTPYGYPIRSVDLSVRSFAGKIFSHFSKHLICCMFLLTMKNPSNAV